MQENINTIRQNALADLSRAKSSRDLERLRIKYFGRKEGELTKILRSLDDLPKEERKKTGFWANKVKQELISAFNKTHNRIRAAELFKKEEFFDVTLPGKKKEMGHAHPLTQVRIEVEEIFKSMGFEVHEGNELTNMYYNFLALNFPKDHPAMDSYDTFFVKSEARDLAQKQVMRAHTSNMQVKIMEQKKPPLRVIVPGRCFRNEATDASHEHTFYQCEGFLVDENISVANLIYTLREFLKAYFKKQDVNIRLRPGYFPFVEPGFELDFECNICGGRGCSVCKHTGWLELIPCGMIHPNVLKSAGYPYGKYSGFAFGMGLTRLVMMKYNIDDIRLFMSGDLRFLEQF